ncbi:hypothetical protein [Vulcanococcus limneticus]|uniref:hypothetical protein n=1 Tax=Vulcanococcus limneticus TaxID=2170428 RepID=UPI00398BDE56
MSVAVLTAHAALSRAAAEAVALTWLEDLGLEVSYGESSHLLATSESPLLLLELDFYPLTDVATQVRWHLRRSSSGVPSQAERELVRALRSALDADPHWQLDGFQCEWPELPAL